MSNYENACVSWTIKMALITFDSEKQKEILETLYFDTWALN